MKWTLEETIKLDTYNDCFKLVDPVVPNKYEQIITHPFIKMGTDEMTEEIKRIGEKHGII